MESAARALHGLRRLVRALRASAHEAERGLGVSGAQLFVLREIAAEPGVSLNGLAQRTFTDASSASVVVAALVGRGLVTRRRDPADGRRALLSLSARGQALLKRAPEPVQVRLIEALSALPERKARAFADILGELNEALGLDRGAAGMFFEEDTRKKVRRGR